jgi:exodeoxyribonuclease V alpha subunit
VKESPLIDQSAFPLQEVEGVLERITFHNEENGYTVARLIPNGKAYEVTVVGALAGVNVGESLRLFGYWTTHSQYGRQFEVRTYTVQHPATIEGIRKYLGSGLIRGIGPATASRIVDYFGLHTLAVIDNEVHRLREVPGIGEKRTEQITSAWVEQKYIKEVMVFLQSYGVSTGLAVKIYKAYGDQSIPFIRSDPYRLARDIYGIGFKTADQIAQKLGLAANAPARIQAGLLYTLSELSNEGHCYAKRQQLANEAANLLGIPAPDCEQQIDQMVLQQEITADDDRLYLPPFFYAERGTANKIRRLLDDRRDRLSVFINISWEKAFIWLDETTTLRLTESQKQAIKTALTHKVSVLTGGPGTGKSTIMASLVKLLIRHSGSVLLCAPTGRAAKRLSDTTGLDAKTIHRLLEYSPTAEKPFLRDQANPLDADLIIIDETSMVDILLMNHLLSAIDSGSHLLMVGDVDQLPSVGPGNVLGDIITSKVIPVTRLETIFRQAEDSYIIVNAHRINHGEMPVFLRDSRDFFLFPEENAQKAADWIFDLVTQRISDKFGFQGSTDIQVLTPMHRGVCGVSELNDRLQAGLNPAAASKVEFRHGHRIFRESDRVMQIRNNYERQVFNGDLGHIASIDLENQLVTAQFDMRMVGYDLSELDELVHAYAISIHKSQGCEFPVVVIPLLIDHYRMLQRNLVYTAVTRARNLVVLVGSKRAIRIALDNNRIIQRNTQLSERLRQGENQAASATNNSSSSYRA